MGGKDPTTWAITTASEQETSIGRKLGLKSRYSNVGCEHFKLCQALCQHLFPPSGLFYLLNPTIVFGEYSTQWHQYPELGEAGWLFNFKKLMKTLSMILRKRHTCKESSSVLWVPGCWHLLETPVTHIVDSISRLFTWWGWRSLEDESVKLNSH